MESTYRAKVELYTSRQATLEQLGRSSKFQSVMGARLTEKLKEKYNRYMLLRY